MALRATSPDPFKTPPPQKTKTKKQNILQERMKPNKPNNNNMKQQPEHINLLYEQQTEEVILKPKKEETKNRRPKEDRRCEQIKSKNPEKPFSKTVFFKHHQLAFFNKTIYCTKKTMWPICVFLGFSFSC